MQINRFANSEEIDQDINHELDRSKRIHEPKFVCTMQAFGVITEEYNEVAEAFHRSKDDTPTANSHLHMELIQLAAMCKKAIESCCIIEKRGDR